MSKHLIVLSLFLLAVHCSAQTATKPDANATKPAKTSVETKPQYPGGDEAMYEFIAQNLNYPEEAIENNISGKVVVGFMIDTLGNVTNVKVIKSVSAELDAEAIRVVKLLKNWIPATRAGKKVKVKYSIPISFTLE